MNNDKLEFEWTDGEVLPEELANVLTEEPETQCDDDESLMLRTFRMRCLMMSECNCKYWVNVFWIK